MLKLIGACLIIGGGTVWGFFEADKLLRRTEKLEQIVFALKLLENEVVYGKRDIKSSLSLIGKNQGPEYLVYAAENIERLGIKTALCESVDKYEKDILGTDKNTLKILWDNLGMTDSASQVKAIRHVKGILEEAKTAAESEYAKTGKLKRSMGFLGGVFAVILLL